MGLEGKAGHGVLERAGLKCTSLEEKVTFQSAFQSLVSSPLCKQWK